MNKFLNCEHALKEYQEEMNKLTALKQEIEIKRQKPIEAGMFFIDCNEFIEKLYVSVAELKNRLTVHLQKQLASYAET